MRQITGLTAAAILLAGTLHAADQTVSGRLKLTYYECTTPKISCFALTKQERDACQRCTSWEERQLDQDLAVTLEGSRYRWKQVGKQGSRVLADFGAEVTGTPAQEAPKFRQLYSSPSAFGYLEVPAGVAIQPGMAAVYPDFGGIITASAETPGSAPLVYSSKSGHGALKVGQLQTVAPAGRRKIIVDTRMFRSRKANPVYWNLLPREAGDRSRVTVLRPGTDYELRVDLSAIDYGSQGLSGTTSANTRHLLDDFLAGDAAGLDLDLVLVTGHEFEGESEGEGRETKLHIDLDKMRRWFGPPTVPAPAHTLPPDPLAEVVQNREPEFVFSSGKPFLVHTSSSAIGMTSLTVTMWYGSPLKVPIDELTFAICIASPEDEKGVCTPSSVLSQGFSGEPDLAAPPSEPPAVAIALVAAGSNRHVHGIMRDNRLSMDSEFVHWDLGKTMDELRGYVANSLELALSSEEVRFAGFALYQEIFSDPKVQKAFLAAVKDEMTHTAPPEESATAELTSPPRLLFRIIDTKGPVILPVSFLTLELSPGVYEPVGFHFRLDLPFGESVSTQHGACISRWMLLYPETPPNAAENDRTNPGSVDAIVKAVLQASSTLGRWTTGKQGFSVTDIGDFGKWISNPESEKASAALVVLAHHASDNIWFNPDHPINAGLATHPFAPPSFAILDGCGTGGSAANQFAQNLREHHVTAMVVTNTNIKGDLAGDYLNALSEVLEADASHAGISLADAHFRALHRLAAKKATDSAAAPYNEHALSFMLLGNGNVALCAPHREESRP